jgi:hypothetical protein
MPLAVYYKLEQSIDVYHWQVTGTRPMQSAFILHSKTAPHTRESGREIRVSSVCESTRSGFFYTVIERLLA